MKTMKFLVPFLIILAITACTKDDQQLSVMSKKQDNNLTDKKFKIAVISDLHLMEASLLKSDGYAFQMYLMQDPKLLQQSEAILKQIIFRLLVEKPDLALISGDLTKDGELVSHQAMVKHLQILTENGIKVVVIPGNHDINNPDAKQFDGNMATPVESVTADQFKSLYSNFGYNDAISNDDNSLSYVSEPVKGLQILAIDANEYYNNTPTYSVVAGKIKDQTMNWAKDQIAEAKANGKIIIGMMHHGLVEHFMGESFIFPDFLVDNRASAADTLMKAGLKVIFTGHFHANDAIQRKFENYTLTDVETGSAVSYNSPYRIAELRDSKLYINTKNIERIFYPGLNGIHFRNYSKDFTMDGITLQSKYMLMNPPYYVPEPYANQIAPVFAQAMVAHLIGDETVTTEISNNILMVSGLSEELGNILKGLYMDLPPTDNTLVIDLK